jgi:hypothetical protein
VPPVDTYLVTCWSPPLAPLLPSSPPSCRFFLELDFAPRCRAAAEGPARRERFFAPDRRWAGRTPAGHTSTCARTNQSCLSECRMGRVSTRGLLQLDLLYHLTSPSSRIMISFTMSPSAMICSRGMNISTRAAPSTASCKGEGHRRRQIVCQQAAWRHGRCGSWGLHV